MNSTRRTFLRNAGAIFFSAILAVIKSSRCEIPARAQHTRMYVSLYIPAEPAP